MKTFDTFAGYGGAEFALTKAGVEHECVGFSEIDKFAIQCFEKNHPGVKNFGSISEIDVKDLPDFDLLCGGFPCQDVSIAGKRDLSKGRTLLIEHVFRIIKAKQPKYLLLENVKGLLSMQPLWDSIRLTLKNLGYGVAFKVLNSKHFGIPQNRERVWIVCKLGGWDFMEFMFPNPEPLKLFIKDLLEEEVDSKYYLSEKSVKTIMSRNHKEFDGIAPTMCKSMHKLNESTPLVEIADFRTDEGLRIRKDGCSPCLSGSSRGGVAPQPIVHSLFPRSGDPTKGGTGHLQKEDGTSYCVDTGNSQAIEKGSRWRRLTPKECFRLMGFLDDEINLDGLSDTQCYKLAGNGWDINVVSKIFKRLFHI